VSSMTKLVLTLLGDDQPGLVSRVSRAVADEGGSWLESQLARLAGTFAGIALVEVPAERVESLRAAFAGLSDVIEVVVKDAAAQAPVSGRKLVLHLVGHDQPGIVRSVTEVLAARGVSIEQLATATVEAPMAGGLLFEADAVLTAPNDVDTDDLQGDLESLARELMVDLDLTPAP
jgi:glycine cleavage system regulatory protein